MAEFVDASVLFNIVGYETTVELNKPFCVLSWRPNVVDIEDMFTANCTACVDVWVESVVKRFTEDMYKLDCVLIVEPKIVDCEIRDAEPAPLNVLNERNVSELNVDNCSPAGDDKYVRTLDWNCVPVDNIIACVIDDVVE